MQCEMDALLRNHELISLPKGKKTVDYKWVFNINFLADGIRERYKAWLVTKASPKFLAGLWDYIPR